MPNLVNSILEKIDEIRVSRDSLKQIIRDNLNVDTSTFKLIECMNYIENNVLKPSFAIRPKYEEYVDLICPLNVRLTNTSWVSLDFAMNDISLDKELVYLFGIHETSLRCYLTNGKLHICTTSEVPMLQEITLDSNRHTLAFGFTGEVREADGYARFQVEFDDVVVANDFVEVPPFNLPFSLYDIPHTFNGTYEDYIDLGGIAYLINDVDYTCNNKSLFDVFALNFYDIVDGERKAIKVYSPGLDSEQKTAFLEKISGEYQYPSCGRYLYVKILGDTTTVITNTSFEKPLPPGDYYLKPSAGAILPTDIVLTSTTQVTMYVKGFDSFDEEVDITTELTEDQKKERLYTRVMLGARPNLIVSPFNSNDVSIGLPWYEHEEGNMPVAELASMVSDGSIGFYVDGAQDSRGTMHGALSTATARGNVPQTATMTGEHIIRVGFDVWDVNNFNLETDDMMKRGISIDGNPPSNRFFGSDPTIHVAFNNSIKTPVCFFGIYNNTSTTPNEVIGLGYQTALNQIGYTTGVRYGVKQIDVTVRNADGSITVTHRLKPAVNRDGVNYFKDTITGSSYYVFNGTLDVQTEAPDSSIAPDASVTPDPSVNPNPDTPDSSVTPDTSVNPDTPSTPDASGVTLLAQSYVKPSQGGIVPTDIVLTSTTQITMHIKGIDEFDNISDGTAEEILRKKVMFGAQPNLFISPINGNDVNRNMPWWGEQHKLSLEEVAGVFSNGTIGMCVFGQQDNRLDRNQFLYSSSNADSVDKIQTLTMNGEHVIKFGHEVFDVNNFNFETDSFMNRVLSIDGKPDTEKRFGPDNNILVAFNNSKRTPICFFGTYNNVETTPDDVIALGYENALSQIGYTTGVRYGVKEIIITDRYPVGTRSETHHLVPASDSSGTILLYDTVTGSKYYPFNGTLDVM